VTTLFDPLAPVTPRSPLKAKVELRPYQQQSVSSILEAFDSSASTLLVLPTGTGKTICFASLIGKVPGQRTLVLAHREELIWQAVQKIKAVTGQEPAVEMANKWSDEYLEKSPIVVSSIQTQVAGKNGKGRMTRFKPWDFGLVIVDEAHHAPAKTYRRVIDWYKRNPDIKILGVTATPDRHDEAALGQIFDTVAFDYEINDAIRDGWLVNILQTSVFVDGLDFSHARTTAGDLNGADLAKIMEEEETLHGIATPTIELAKGRKTLVFAASVHHAERLCEIFNRHERGCARFVCGKTAKDERRQVVEDYAAGRFQFLTNVGVATEGFDDPSIAVVSIARPTKSRALYAQMVGRGTRPLPGIADSYETAEDRREGIRESDKPSLEVIDFVGNAGRHKLMTTADILGGNYDDDIVERATRNAQEKNAPVDMLEELDKAKEQIHAERKAERERRRHVIAQAEYRTQVINPFELLDIEPERERGWHRGRQLTEKMTAMLQRNGFDPTKLNYTHAKQVIGEIINHPEKMPCTAGQAKVLRRFGYKPENHNKQQASEVIDALANNGWRRP